MQVHASNLVQVPQEWQIRLVRAHAEKEIMSDCAIQLVKPCCVKFQIMWGARAQAELKCKNGFQSTAVAWDANRLDNSGEDSGTCGLERDERSIERES